MPTLNHKNENGGSWKLCKTSTVFAGLETHPGGLDPLARATRSRAGLSHRGSVSIDVLVLRR